MKKSFQIQNPLKSITVVGWTFVALTFLSACGPDYSAMGGKSGVAKGAASDSNSDENENDSDFSSLGANTSAKSPLEWEISGVGYTSKSITVSTQTLLKVRFTPGRQSQPDESGNLLHYSGLGVYIQVGSDSRATPLLYNGYPSGNGVESSAVLDFSKSFKKTCASTDCVEKIKITVYQPNSDVGCLNRWDIRYCPYTQQPADVPWNGKLEIQTDFTSALESTQEAL